jgi:hypothetical protein
MHQIDQSWEEVFRRNYDRASARRRKERAKQPSPSSRERSRQELATAKIRLDERYREEKAQAEANPYFRNRLDQRTWQFMAFPLWIEHRAKEGNSDAKKVVAASYLAENHQKRLEAKDLAKARLAHGYRWKGGAVGGNPLYYRHPFYRSGLVSNDYPILQLFVTKCRRARDLRSGSTKDESNRVWSKLVALDDAYIETNRTMRGVLRVEIDMVFPSWQKLRAAISALGVPLPILAVAHLDIAGRVHRPHLLWLLDSSVAFSDKGKVAAKVLFKHVLTTLTAALLPIGSDPGGLSNPNRHKNPCSPLWDRRVFTRVPFDLERLRDGIAPVSGIAMDTVKAALGEGRPSDQIFAPLVPDHSDPAVAEQSNRVFARVAAVARRKVSWHRDEGHGSLEEFQNELEDIALGLVSRSSKAEAHALSVAGRVAKWTWQNFKPRRNSTLNNRLSQEERYAARAESGRVAGRVRSHKTVVALVAAIRDLQATSQRVTQAAVARASSRSLRTVERHWSAVQSHKVNAQSEPGVAPVIRS